MKKFKKIMVAVDFSEYSEDTMKYAVALADSLKAKLIVANVLNQRDITGCGNRLSSDISRYVFL